MAAKIWVVGAGKGGVGKSFVTSSLAIALTKLNLSVLAVDLDLGGANLHSHLGMQPSSPSIQAFFAGQLPLANLVKPTPIPRLSLIQGCWEEWEHTNCGVGSTTQLLLELRRLPFDVVLVDLGPGSNTTHLEIFHGADEKILLTSPEPTSVEKTYRFLESWILFRASENSTKEALLQLKSSLKKFRSEKKTGHFSFRDYLEKAGGFAPDNFAALAEKPIQLLVNSSRSHLDEQLGYSIRSVCKKYYDLPLNYLGYIDYDNAVWHSIRNHEAFLIAKPFTTLSGQFLSLGKSLIDPEIQSTLHKVAV